MALETFITRRPVLDRRQHVWGYELRYASSSADSLFAALDVELGLQRLVDGLLAMGPVAATGGRTAVVRATRELLVSGAMALLPPTTTVVAVEAGVEPDAEVARACRELARQGTALALHDHRPGDPREVLLDRPALAWVAVDDAPAVLAAHVGSLRARAATVVADGVDDAEALRRATGAGCELFSGLVLSAPVLVEGRQAEGVARTYARLLGATSGPDVDLGLVEQVVKSDVALSHKLLRHLNAAAFGWHQPITSVRHGLVLLGTDHVRRWASLAALAGMASEKPSELVVTSVVRARFCEALGEAAGHADRAFDLFGLGMFSLLDAILDQPLSVALEGVPLADDARAALGGEPNRLRAVLDAVTGYERADWAAVAAAAARLGVPTRAVPGRYLDAVAWADGVLRPSATAA